MEGKPSQVYAQGMRSFEQYDEISKYFAEEKQKDNNANEVQKHLQLHGLGVGEHLTDKYALCMVAHRYHSKSLNKHGMTCFQS